MKTSIRLFKVLLCLNLGVIAIILVVPAFWISESVFIFGALSSAIVLGILVFLVQINKTYRAGEAKNKASDILKMILFSVILSILAFAIVVTIISHVIFSGFSWG